MARRLYSALPPLPLQHEREKGMRVASCPPPPPIKGGLRRRYRRRWAEAGWVSGTQLLEQQPRPGGSCAVALRVAVRAERARGRPLRLGELAAVPVGALEQPREVRGHTPHNTCTAQQILSVHAYSAHILHSKVGLGRDGAWRRWRGRRARSGRCHGGYATRANSHIAAALARLGHVVHNHYHRCAEFWPSTRAPQHSQAMRAGLTDRGWVGGA